MGHSMSVIFRRLSLARAGLLGASFALVACGETSGDGESFGSVSATLCSGTAVTANPAGPTDAGTVVTLTAGNATCASGETAEYRFYYKRENTSDAYTMLRDYAGGPTAAWNTAGLASGRYQILVYTRSVGSTASFQHIAYFSYYIKNVCSTGAIATSPASPQSVGTPITLTGSASCTGAATPEFSYWFKRQDVAKWTQISPYASGSAAWDTTGLSSGTYNLLAQIRAAGNASSSEGYAYATFLVGSTVSHPRAA